MSARKISSAVRALGEPRIAEREVHGTRPLRSLCVTESCPRAEESFGGQFVAVQDPSCKLSDDVVVLVGWSAKRQQFVRISCRDERTNAIDGPVVPIARFPTHPSRLPAPAR